MGRLLYIIGTGFGAGYTPGAPGTAGSLVGALLAWFFFRDEPLQLIAATVLCTILGVFAANYIAADQKNEDPSLVVVDEIAGMWLTLWFVPASPWLYVVAFAVFRLFDVTKPFPVRQLENFHGGWGIMLDDLGAGVYSLAIVHLIVWFL